MRKRLVLTSLLAVARLAVLVASTAFAHGDNGGKKGSAKLSSYNEVPLTISSTGNGSFRLRVRSDGIQYTLRYEDLETDASVAHIHFGKFWIAGGVIAFLCGGGDKPACPGREGEVTGTIDAADVVGPANQGIEAGSFSEVLRALRKGSVYVNVHTARFPGGEIRGQIENNGHGRKHDDRKRDK